MGLFAFKIEKKVRADFIDEVEPHICLMSGHGGLFIFTILIVSLDDDINTNDPRRED